LNAATYEIEEEPMKSDEELFEAAERVKHWNALFAGQWCRVSFTTQGGVDGMVREVGASGVILSEMLEVYPEIKPIRAREAVIETTTMLIPFEHILTIRTTPRATAEQFCRAMNTTHVINPRDTRSN
jgi:hypothetical protein